MSNFIPCLNIEQNGIVKSKANCVIFFLLIQHLSVNWENGVPIFQSGSKLVWN